MPRILLLCLLISVAAPAAAVYKCETEGRISYSDAPCPAGKLMSNTSTPADREAAERRGMIERSELKRLQHERHKREAQEEKERQRAAHAGAARQKRCAKLALRVKHAEEDARTAVGKARERTALKARRVAEQRELECGK